MLVDDLRLWTMLLNPIQDRRNGAVRMIRRGCHDDEGDNTAAGEIVEIHFGCRDVERVVQAREERLDDAALVFQCFHTCQIKLESTKGNFDRWHLFAAKPMGLRIVYQTVYGGTDSLPIDSSIWMLDTSIDDRDAYGGLP